MAAITEPVPQTPDQINDDILRVLEPPTPLYVLAVLFCATLVGVGVVVEKTFEGGRGLMLQAGYTDIPIEALAVITSMEDGKIVIAD